MACTYPLVRYILLTATHGAFTASVSVLQILHSICMGSLAYLDRPFVCADVQQRQQKKYLSTERRKTAPDALLHGVSLGCTLKLQRRTHKYML